MRRFWFKSVWRYRLGGVQTGMAEPALHAGRIDFGFNQVRGGGVAKIVRRQMFGGDAWVFLAGESKVFDDDIVDTEAGECAAALIDEEMILGRRPWACVGRYPYRS